MLPPAMVGPQIILVREREREGERLELTSLSVDVGRVHGGVGGDGAYLVVVDHVVSCCHLDLGLLRVDQLGLFLPGVVGLVEQRRQGGREAGSYLGGDLVRVTVGVEGREVTFKY